MACVRAVTSDDRTTGEWLCIVDRKGSGLDIREDMTVQVEVKDASAHQPDLVTLLEERLKSDLGIRVTVELVPPGSLRDYTYGREGMARRLLTRGT
jgi:phenylacetate-CoA ligase